MTLPPLLSAMGLALLAGLAMPLGAMVARIRDWPDSRITHFITAFGGGALVSAVALVLVPDGADHLGAALSVGLFCFGGLVFCLADAALSRSGGAGAQLMAMLLDFLPEAAALRALLAVDPGTATLLAGLIFLQNVPEGFAAYREIEGPQPPHPALIVGIFVGLAMLGPAFAALGHLWLADHRAVLGGIMLFAAGGILYLVFEDIAPASREAGDWVPPLGAVAGFALGLAGHLITS